MSEHKEIFKSASVISAFTVLSRITGLVRDVLLANLFGTQAAAQAFFVAFKIPNAFRDIVGEGAGNAAFVPVFCECLQKRPKADFLKLVNSLFRVLFGISVLLVLAGIVFSPGIVRLVAPGFSNDIAKFGLTVTLNRLLFPYLALITISAFMMSVSNSLKSFAAPASSSVVFNIALIFSIFFITHFAFPNPVYALCAAVLAAAVVQVFFQLPPLWKMGIDFKKGGVYSDVFKEPAIRRVGRLILPRIVGTSIYQLNIFVDTIFASFAFWVGDGAIAAIYYANRIIQFPFSIFGVALSNAALPNMSANSANQDMEKFKTTLLFCLKAVFLGVIPLTVGILVFAQPLVQVIFQRGSFDAYSTSITALAVFFYAFGLVSYVGVRFLSHAFYALQDTMTPVKVSAVGLFMNIILDSLFIFVFKFQISGLALASSISAAVNFYLLYRALNKRIGFNFGHDFSSMAARSFIISVVVVLIVFGAWQRWFYFAPTFLKMCVVFCLGAVLYAAGLWVCRVREAKELLLWLRKRR
jgi:putative peptidoglycan lipid II flippase